MLQKFLKKLFSLMATSLAVLILSGFLSLRPVSKFPILPSGDFPGAPSVLANDTADNPCKDITHAGGKTGTDTVDSPSGTGREAGISDSGRLNFDKPDSPGGHNLQACSENGETTRVLPISNGTDSQDISVTGRFLRGWAWNTNLGWVSLYCENGDNFGSICGSGADSIDYGVVRQNDKLYGFAYGDNIGWISMGCAAGRNLRDGNCGSADYGVQVATADGQAAPTSCSGSAADGTLEKGQLFGHAWSDSVGWINFCGAKLDITTSNFEIDPGPIIIPNPNPASPVLVPEPGATGTEVYANGLDSYKIVVQVKDSGVPVPEATYTSANIRVVGLDWIDTTLRADQVASTDAALAGSANSGALVPATTEFRYEADATAEGGGLVAHVRAIAPTGESDTVKLASMQVQIASDPAEQFDNSGAGWNFNFLPAIAVTKTESPDETGAFVEDKLFALNSRSQELKIEIAKHKELSEAGAAVALVAQLYDCDAIAYDYVFDEEGNDIIKTVNDDGAEVEENGKIAEPSGTFPNIEKTNTCSTTSNPPDHPVSDALTLAAIDFGPDPTVPKIETTYVYAYPQEDARISSFEVPDTLALQTIVSYTLTGKTVRYFSHKTSGGVLNQATLILGNVRGISVDTEGLPSGGISESLGENAQSKREMFYRAVNTVIGRNRNITTTTTSFSNWTFDRTNGNIGGGISYYKFNGNTPCRIIFKNDTSAATSFNWANDLNSISNKTIVTEGCDIFIDQNIHPTASPTAPRPGRLGIVALQDLKTGKGGNVYICNLVTDVSANIVADGSIFSYGNNLTNCGTTTNKDTMVNSDGTPNFGTAVAERELLKHQLTITGSIVSNNTYGGALAAQPLLCDGTKVDLAAITNADEKRTKLKHARYCDINFLRYAKTEPNSNVDSFGEPMTSPAYCWTTDIKLSKTFTLDGISDSAECHLDTLNNFPEVPAGKGIVNIRYRAPADTQPIFNRAVPLR